MSAVTAAYSSAPSDSDSSTYVQINLTGASGAEMEIVINDGAALPSDWRAIDFLL